MICENGVCYVQGGQKKKQSRAKLQTLAAIFHTVALSWYLYVWTWHFTSDTAKVLPGASGFGRFFRYLTFYSYTLQLIQLLASFCCHLPKALRIPAAEKFADDLSCAVFGLANVVTCMFYLIDAATSDVVEGGKVDHQRPPWLGVSVHFINSVVAWLDILLSHPRSFSRRSQNLSIGLVIFYLHWILLCSFMNGSFPYPFLNKLPQPQGFIGVSVGGVCLFVSLFRLGKWLMTPIQTWKVKDL
ncbi:g7961 [Coccomyxa elongata]